jgi:hypothetical protein
LLGSLEGGHLHSYIINNSQPEAVGGILPAAFSPLYPSTNCTIIIFGTYFACKDINLQKNNTHDLSTKLEHVPMATNTRAPLFVFFIYYMKVKPEVMFAHVPP